MPQRLLFLDCHRVLGPELLATSTSAWNLFRTLQDSGELAAELAALKRDLLWLLDRDAATLSVEQRTVRMCVAEAVSKNWSAKAGPTTEQ